MSQLHIQVAQKKFAGHTVLHNVNLQVNVGQVLCLIGASGCGKSTLLRIVSGLERDYSGRVILENQILNSVSPDVGFIFQEPRLLPWLTVAENIAFNAGGDVDPARVEALLADVGLTGFGEALPKQLSGGQAQRVAIARGLYNRPKVLLLDEPFSAVDAFTRIRLQDLLASITQTYGITVLLVTHDVDEAVYLADRIIVIGDRPGTVVADITIDLSEPRERESSTLLKQRSVVFDALHQANVV